MTREDYINDEYNRALIRYQAMKALKDGITPTPEPIPQPTPEPIPTPTPTPTTEHTLVYDGQSNYTLEPGESVTISVYDYNAENTRDVYCEISNEPSTVKHKTYETKFDGGIKIDFVLTAAGRGISFLKTYLAADKDDKSKWITVIIDVK